MATFYIEAIEKTTLKLIKNGQSTMVFTCGNIDIFTGTIKIRYNESFVSV